MLYPHGHFYCVHSRRRAGNPIRALWSADVELERSIDRHGFHSQTTRFEFDSQGDCFSLRFWQPTLDSLTRIEEVRVYVAYTVYGVEYGREEGSMNRCDFAHPEA
jgi:hypothetical protein